MTAPGIGHNGARLSSAAKKAGIALAGIAKSEGDIVEWWRAYGAALNDARAEYGDDDKSFGQWVEDLLRQVGGVKPHDHEQSAAMWAARQPDDFAAIRAKFPAVRTVRGWHAKWKDEEARRLPEVAQAEAEAAWAEADKAKAVVEAAVAEAARQHDTAAEDAAAKAKAEAAEKAAAAVDAAKNAEAAVEKCAASAAAKAEVDAAKAEVNALEAARDVAMVEAKKAGTLEATGAWITAAGKCAVAGEDHLLACKKFAVAAAAAVAALRAAEAAPTRWPG